METLQINKANALIAYEEANAKGKKLLANLFGEKVFIKDIKERIQTFDDVLQLNGIDADELKSTFEGLTTDEVAYIQVKLIVKAYNQGWTPNWSDSSDYKY